MTPQENNAIYIISHPQGWLKVGYSKHPEIRLRQHQAKSGAELKGEHIFPCENPVQVERKVHKAMASHRIMGEWFELNPTEAADLITKTTGLLPEPFPLTTANKTLPISFRLPPETKIALESAAKTDMRSVSSLCEKILTEWLRKEGHLTD